MKPTDKDAAFGHTGSSFADFLQEEGLYDEAKPIALKRVIEWQLKYAAKERRKPE
jgi:antitoxin HicB